MCEYFGWQVRGLLEFFQLLCFDRSSAPFHHAAAVLAPALAPAIGWRSPFDIYDVVPVVDTGMDQVRNADPFTLLVDGVRSEERRVGKECVSTGRFRWLAVN